MASKTGIILIGSMQSLIQFSGPSELPRRIKCFGGMKSISGIIYTGHQTIDFGN
jgi:hypothetical protein